ncbi:hypothetical protein PF011_g13608 [Phytophthora fragariae]|uniref:Death domain-containing protein n=1 Tax=Phytophthora fragariae TaxID=53985 RepID=A0A6A3KCK0_9STRA|nr:hypothetical protein PF011_g13608 [Phytophthora fragariae]
MQLDFWLSTQNQKSRPRAAMNKLLDLLARLTRSDGVRRLQDNQVNCHAILVVNRGRGRITRDSAGSKNTKANTELPLELAAMKAIAEDSA